MRLESSRSRMMVTQIVVNPTCPSHRRLFAKHFIFFVHARICCGCSLKILRQTNKHTNTTELVFLRRKQCAQEIFLVKCNAVNRITSMPLDFGVVIAIACGCLLANDKCCMGAICQREKSLNHTHTRTHITSMQSVRSCRNVFFHFIVNEVAAMCGCTA